MTRRIIAFTVVLFLIVSFVAEVTACSLCGGSYQRRSTMREEAKFAKIVVLGTVENARFIQDGSGLSSGAATDLRITKVLKDDPALKGIEKITIPRYIPVDENEPATYLVFCDVFDGKLDPYRGTPAQSDKIAAYLKDALKKDPAEDADALVYYFQHLDSKDPDIAKDAFLEFAKASDRAVGEVASKLDLDRLGTLLKTAPAERLGVYAFLLGARGGEKEAELLKNMLQDGSERTRLALSGLLGGYIELKPAAGWAMVNEILADPNRRFADKLSVLGTVRFYHGWKPKETREEILKAMSVLVRQGDLADLAVEDLRRWQWWDLTEVILEQFPKKSHSSPLVQRAIVRYALSCPRPESAEFVSSVEKSHPELVKDLRNALKFEQDSSQ